MKVLITQFCHETNTFAADRTDIDRFRQIAWISGEPMLESRRNGTDYLSGMMTRAEELGFEVIPGFSAFSGGGLILRETYQAIKDNTLAAVRDHLGEYGGICISLHGAAVSQNIDDLELELLTSIRDIVGNDMPIVATFDLHGNISARTAQLLSGAVAVKEYPHIDCDTAGAAAMQILAGLLQGQLQTAVAHCRIPMLVPCATACTFDKPALTIKEYIADYTRQKGLVDVSFFHGFPYADLPITGASVVVTAKSAHQAQAVAREVAQYIWDRRHQFDAADYLPVKAAVDKALALDGGPIVINETSDNPGGGTPADGTHLLRELLERNLPGTCFGFIYDPEFVQRCVDAGVGNRVSGRLGAKTDEIHGTPIEVRDALVKMITDGSYISQSPVFNKGSEISIGRSVRVKIGAVDVIVASVRMQTLDDGLFLLHNINVGDYKIIALKSTQHFRAVFDALAKDIVTADPPGIHTANFSLLTYHSLTRPIYPLDKDAAL